MSDAMLAHVATSGDGTRLEAGWSDGARAEFPAAWLFDNADEALEPGSRQRGHGALALESVRSVELVVVGQDAITLRFAPGGELRAVAIEALRPSAPTRAAHELWLTPRPVAQDAPLAFDAYVSDDDSLHEVLRRVARYGVALLTGAGEAPGAVERVVGRFGYVRETNYGRTFDVRIETRPSNLAYTARALDLPTDNPSRDRPPSLQLLHAIATSADGGENRFVDGFAHAEALRREAPARFERLACQPVPFRFTGPSGDHYEALAPIIEISSDGSLAGVRVNHRSLGALPMAPDRTEAWYEAYLDFYRRLHAPAAGWAHRMSPGEVVIFDNRRILHGRSGFPPDAGDRSRWFEGCYAERDGLLATLARLEQRRR
jgi:hypothetical protein